MADNNSAQSGGGGYSSLRPLNYKIIIVQVLITIFLYINTVLLVTLFSKEYFRTNMRYIFFANTLLADGFFLIVANVLLIVNYYRATMPVLVCLCICGMSTLYLFVTPLTLTAMTLERFVAICMPLRHGELCTPRSSLHCILLIYVVGSLPISIIYVMFLASTGQGVHTQTMVCAVEMLIIERWQGHVRSAISQLYFVMMSVPIVFSYVKIMKVAKTASAESKKSTGKGLRTVILHAFQLFLCLIQLWCPLIEAAVLQYDYDLFFNIRYVNYVTLILAPRCLSPLIYGLRDEKFFFALRYYVFCGLNKKMSTVIPGQ